MSRRGCLEPGSGRVFTHRAGGAQGWIFRRLIQFRWIARGTYLPIRRRVSPESTTPRRRASRPRRHDKKPKADVRGELSALPGCQLANVALPVIIFFPHTPHNRRRRVLFGRGYAYRKLRSDREIEMTGKFLRLGAAVQFRVWGVFIVAADWEDRGLDRDIILKEQLCAHICKG